MPKQLHHVVTGLAVEAEEVFNSSFLAAWLLTPILSPENVSHPDEFGMFMMGGPL